jgi:mRNA interferase RelE/StbE
VTGSYSIALRRSAEKELRAVPKADLERITAKIGNLGMNPRPPGCEKMAVSDHYRIRQGDWRIVLAVDDTNRTVTIIKIGHRSEVYR